jgi:hypothetical protein
MELDILSQTIDTSVPHSSRVYDYWLGGKDNFAADRALAQSIMEWVPIMPAKVRANRAFLGRAVQYMAQEEGIRQFLDIGAGLPTARNTHEVARETVPDARVLYVDNDPIVIAHGRALMSQQGNGQTDSCSLTCVIRPQSRESCARQDTRRRPAGRADAPGCADVHQRLRRSIWPGFDLDGRTAVWELPRAHTPDGRFRPCWGRWSGRCQ